MDYFLNSFFITLGISSALLSVLVVLAIVGTVLTYFKK